MSLLPFIKDKAKFIYTDPTTVENKNRIIQDNKNKAGIYLWFNIITRKYYVGQSKNLGDPKSGRLFRYLRPA